MLMNHPPKILDVEIISPFCQGCIQIETFKTKDTHLCEKYRNDQHCSINHDDSAAKIKVTGVKGIFGRSIVTNKIKYTEYYGDGDT